MSDKRRGKFIWGKDATTALIELYQNHPVLYAVQDPDYKNRSKRDAALEAIKQELLKLPFCSAQCLDVEDIKIKLHTMRSQFNREWKKKVASETTGAGAVDIYKPTLWFFDLLLFLKDYQETSRSVSNLDNIDLPSTSTTPEPEADSEVIFEGTVEEFNNADLTQELRSTVTPTSSTYKPIKGKANVQKEVAQLISKATASLEQRSVNKTLEQDDIYTFSRSVEAELRKIKSATRVRKLKQMIMSAIWEHQEEEEN